MDAAERGDPDGVKAEFGKFSGVLDKLKKQLNTATETAERTGVRTRAMERKLRHVDDLSEGDSEKLLQLAPTPSLRHGSCGGRTLGVAAVRLGRGRLTAPNDVRDGRRGGMRRIGMASRIQRSCCGISALACLMVLCSCASVGREFPVSPVSEIRIGETTQAQIRVVFGEPWRVGVEDGRKTWTYGKYRYRLFGDRSTTDLVVRFDDKNVVASYSFSTTEHKE